VRQKECGEATLPHRGSDGRHPEGATTAISPSLAPLTADASVKVAIDCKSEAASPLQEEKQTAPYWEDGQHRQRSDNRNLLNIKASPDYDRCCK
jgi:hypothetical protein